MLSAEDSSGSNAPGGRERSNVIAVELTAYKSIGECRVALGPLTFLVGRNGAGKSNFLNALQFLHDATDTNLESAVRSHGSPGSIRRLGCVDVVIAIDITLSGRSVSYSLALSMPENNYEVMHEILVAPDAEPLTLSTFESHQRVLALPIGAAGNADAKAMYEFIRAMRFYDFSLPAIRSLQDPSEGTLLRSDGGNLASVLEQLANTDPSRYDRLHEYLGAVLPGLKRVRRELLGPKEGIKFETSNGTFFAQHMSTGTLLALAVLTALFQPPDQTGQGPTLVAIEEPERALHPAAAGVLFDAMVEASSDRQVLVATQSPDLLDRKDVAAESLLAVVDTEAGTAIGPVGDNARRVLAKHLFTAGELVRLDQLQPQGEDHSSGLS